MADFRKTEEKWQKLWEKEKIFEAKESKNKKKFYCLEMFPYPSGAGLHMGHAFNYTIGDIYARFMRMKGYNVLYPMGYDSLGLPAENAAIKEGIHPQDYTAESIKNFIRQQKALGLSYDWSRKIITSEPGYYKWDQWIFLKMLEKGLAYRKKSPVNWCPKCQTVLANEQVHDGHCWRHETTKVEVKHLEQWYLRITEYAEELYEGIDRLVGWPELVKKLQRNWIGKSHGTEILFEINGKPWNIYTTRPDTLFGVTFLVVSAQHPQLAGLVTKEQKTAVDALLRKLSSVSEEQIDQLEKEGAFTGSYATHPLTKEKIPVYAGNFVLAEYGCGMVMAVPAHDQRDFEFAKKYKIPIKAVIQPQGKKLEKSGEAYTEKGVLTDSAEFSGMDSEKAKEEITKKLEKSKMGGKTTNFRLRDWLISRQRYWGAPIPIVYCDRCGIVAVPEEELPVKLPREVKFGSSNPLTTNERFANTKCPKCKGKARRETDTMDTFVNSSWYQLRYTDPKNDKRIFDPRKAKYWNPVDLYIGGKEHACMHLIYTRFYTKFLRDLKLLDFDEPATRLFNQGMVHGEDGNKMSKSLGNVINPLDAVGRYSADTLRLFLMSVAAPDSDLNWSDKGMQGSHRFLNRVMGYFDTVKIGKSSKRTESRLNKAIKLVTEDIEGMRYNMAVIKLRELFDNLETEASKDTLGKFLLLMHPFCPHMTEELWQKTGNRPFISLHKWPETDESKIDEQLERQEKAADSLASDINHVVKLVKDKEGKDMKKAFVYVLPQEKKLYAENAGTVKLKTGLDVEIFAVNDKEKYDPAGKSKKAKPGKPAIYLE